MAASGLGSLRFQSQMLFNNAGPEADGKRTGDIPNRECDQRGPIGTLENAGAMSQNGSQVSYRLQVPE